MRCLAHYPARCKRGAIDTENFLSLLLVGTIAFMWFSISPIRVQLEEQALTCLPSDLLLSHPRRISSGHCSSRPACPVQVLGLPKEKPKVKQ